MNVTADTLELAKKDEGKGQSDGELKGWFNLQTVKLLIMGFPSWIFFGVATVASLRQI
jgi:hypothetical protein